MRISYSTRGSFKNTQRFLSAMTRLKINTILEGYGREGVAALNAATPKDSGLAAGAWGYTVTQNSRGFSLSWHNTNKETGFPVAIMLQYGYATGTGGYVRGRDYINPAVRPIFDSIADRIWKEVISA